VNQSFAHKVAAEDRIWRFSATRGTAHEQAYFHCTTCGTVYCLETSSTVPPARVPEGFRVQRTEIMLRGECKQGPCAQ
jgi:Fur family transcriptional regulator, ferric uptake regulator